jgi:hypothetical protein
MLGKILTQRISSADWPIPMLKDSMNRGLQFVLKNIVCRRCRSGNPSKIKRMTPNIEWLPIECELHQFLNFGIYRFLALDNFFDTLPDPIGLVTR